jgi:hypothetical protein
MFVVHFMGTAHTTGIPIVGISKEFKSLVDKNIVHQKIGDTVGQYAKSQWPSVPKPSVVAQEEQGHAHNGVEQEKGIVPFKPRVVVLFVMVFVERP